MVLRQEDVCPKQEREVSRQSAFMLQSSRNNNNKLMEMNVAIRNNNITSAHSVRLSAC